MLRCKKCGGKELRFQTLAEGYTCDGQWPTVWQLAIPEYVDVTCETCGHQGDHLEFYQPQFLFSVPDDPEDSLGQPATQPEQNE